MSPGRKRLVAIGVGVLLGALPAAGFHLWLEGLAERQAREEIDLSLRRTMALAEGRLGVVVATLDRLAGRGLASCLPASIEAMREAAFAAAPVKEISVVAGDGSTLCTQLGLPSEVRHLLTSELLSEDATLLIETVRLGRSGAPMVRLRRPSQTGPDLAALIPPDLMIAQVSTRGRPMNGNARMLTRSGAVLASVGETAVAPAEDAKQHSAAKSSSRYGLRAETITPTAVPDLNREPLRQIATAVTAALAMLLLALALAVRMLGAPRGQRNNPITEMEQALAKGEFVPFYQPVVDIRSGRLRGAEVLLRWRKPDGTLVPPALFIPLAESSGLILELTRSMMRRVRDEAGAALGARPMIKVGFNLTAEHFTNEQIVDDVREIFGRSPIRLSQIVLEVTERQPLENLTVTRRVIAALQGIGVRVAIDDVGTGHSGLSYMLKLGVDIIKIDKMFIDAIGVDRHSTTIVETLIDLARNMRMEVIAEGVENFDQVIHLRELGIRAAQGFVFAPPLPGPAFLQLLDAMEGPRQNPMPRSETASVKTTSLGVLPLRNLRAVN